jgi:hypothetical protein
MRRSGNIVVITTRVPQIAAHESGQKQPSSAPISELTVEAPISACSVEVLKCLSGQLQGKLSFGKLSTERGSLSGV